MSFIIAWVSLLSLLASTCTALSPSDSSSSLPYKDASLPIETRVQDLLGRMTIEEKTIQLMQGDISNWLNTTTGAFNASGLETNFAQKAGMFYVGYPISWDWLADNIKIGQDDAVNQTRLGIPAIVQTEGIHGFLIGNATIFNSPIGQACSWNSTQIELLGQQVAREAKVFGVNQIFAPLADLARELRYGRVEETYGEDSHLTGEMAFSYVRGLQSISGVSAMVKHFAGFGLPEQGLNTGPQQHGLRELRTLLLPPYKRAIIDAGALSIMSAYHSYDGIPAVADEHTLTTILRDEWGYKYWVSSDAGGTDRLATAFGICPQPLNKYGSNVTTGNECVTLDVLTAGNDVEMGGGSFNFRSIPFLVASGRLPQPVVDTAVSRVLRAKFEMGLFESPYQLTSPSDRTSVVNTPASKALAREVDRDSIVLLKNDHNILPISKTAKVAVIGPMADGFVNYGDYVVYRSQYRGVTPLQGVRAAVGNGAVTYAQGCERWSADQSGFPEAISAAEAADVAVVIVGTWSRDQQELWQGLNATTGEHVDVNSLALVGAMGPLVKAIINTGKPTVVVFSSGKPITEPWLSDTSASLVQQFYPSQEGGHALADVLFGDTNPSGKLSVSFPRDVGDLPVTYDFPKSSPRSMSLDSGYINAENGSIHFGHQYVIGSPDPWFPFGFGLSYTTFEYSNISLNATSNVKADDTVLASLQVTNNGTRDGAEVVQIYVRDVLASVDVPNLRLRGFEKVFIKAGQSLDVEIPLSVSDLGVWDRKMQYVVEPGDFIVYAGSSSRDLHSNATFTVV